MRYIKNYSEFINEKFTLDSLKELVGLKKPTEETTPSVSSERRDFKIKTIGEDVKRLQTAMESLGFKLYRFGRDGIYGPESSGRAKSLLAYIKKHHSDISNGVSLDMKDDTLTIAQQDLIISLSTNEDLKNEIAKYFESTLENIKDIKIPHYEDLKKYNADPLEFIKKTVDIANKLQTKPEYLLFVMWKESKYNPAAVNKDVDYKDPNKKDYKGTGATGLIQFMPACLSTDTQILTSKGWKFYNEVELGESILSYNSEKDVVEYDTIKELFVFDSDNTYRIHNKQFDFIATHDHRWYCDYNGKTVIKTTEELSKQNSKYKFIRAKKFNYSNNAINPLFFELLGIIIGDGSLDKRFFEDNNQVCMKNYNIAIYQSLQTKPHVVERIQYILDELYPNSNYTHSHMNQHGMVRWSIRNEHSSLIHTYLNSNKEIIKEKLFDLSEEQLKHLKKGLLITDGTIQYKKYDVFIQCDENRMSDFQLICFLLGECANVKGYKRLHETHIFPNGNIYNVKPMKYHCNVKINKPFTEARTCRMNYDKINKPVKVWCPQTNNKTWIARRNGFVTITGNTAKGLGTTTDALYRMTGVEQLDYVYNFYKNATGKLNTLEDLYLYAFFPIAVGKPDDWVIQAKNQSAGLIATQNPVIDINKSGEITVGEFKQYVRKGLPSNILADNNDKTMTA